LTSRGASQRLETHGEGAPALVEFRRSRRAAGRSDAPDLRQVELGDALREHALAPGDADQRAALATGSGNQLLGAGVRQAQHRLAQFEHLARAVGTGHAADQHVLVGQPVLFELQVGVADLRGRREVLEFDELAVEQGDGAVERALRAFEIDVQADLQIGLGHALREHALAAGLVDRRVDVGDLRLRETAESHEQRQQGDAHDVGQSGVPAPTFHPCSITGRSCAGGLFKGSNRRTLSDMRSGNYDLR